MHSSRLQAALAGALGMALPLLGGLLAGLVVGILLFGMLPGHMNEPVRIALAALPALLGMGTGSALWGVLGTPGECRRDPPPGLDGIPGFRTDYPRCTEPNSANSTMLQRPQNSLISS